MAPPPRPKALSWRPQRGAAARGMPGGRSAAHPRPPPSLWARCTLGGRSTTTPPCAQGTPGGRSEGPLRSIAAERRCGARHAGRCGRTRGGGGRGVHGAAGGTGGSHSPPLTPPSLSAPPGGGEARAGGGLYHERQRLQLCGLHALNNLLQRRCFTRRAAEDICKRLAPGARLNPHRGLLGNYDVNVLMAALQGQGLAALWWDKRRPLERLVLPKIFGFILNVPAGPLLGLIPLPLRRQHWLSLRCFQGVYYNLDSKLPHPVAIGGEDELRAFLRDFLSQGLCEVFLVVPHDVEESGAWLSAE